MKMHFGIIFFLFCSVLSAYATSAVSPKEQNRFLIASNSISFTTFTLLKVTTTTTSTFTSTTTCTTSTAILSTCTTGRRRRGLFYDESNSESRHRRAALFYNENEAENKDGTLFLPVANKPSDPTREVISKPTDQSSTIPLEIESGFTLPEGSPNRFLLSFGTSTVTSLVISYSTVSLTAICISTTGFPLCGGVGK
ncbi:hypothetical protein OUZ56_012000 [Daphnia magna]|uniref:Uncharacterized protein n=1 Tax=Daphnia magna TaxID=35525 RepID=A0ABQ9Z200_9CRUS|nr:hypothetical protein OUZ56_012000 [Daphnia magna]